MTAQRVFTLGLDLREQVMLEQLTIIDGISKAEIVRRLIRQYHAERINSPDAESYRNVLAQISSSEA